MRDEADRRNSKGNVARRRAVLEIAALYVTYLYPILPSTMRKVTSEVESSHSFIPQALLVHLRDPQPRQCRASLTTEDSVGQHLHPPPSNVSGNAISFCLAEGHVVSSAG